MPPHPSSRGAAWVRSPLDIQAQQAAALWRHASASASTRSCTAALQLEPRRRQRRQAQSSQHQTWAQNLKQHIWARVAYMWIRCATMNMYSPIHIIEYLWIVWSTFENSSWSCFCCNSISVRCGATGCVLRFRGVDQHVNVVCERKVRLCGFRVCRV